MTFPASAAVVVVKGYWWADDGTGVPRQVTATPAVDHVTSTSGRGVIDLIEKTATPEGDNPYWELELVASNDPDLIPGCPWTFRMSGYDGAWTVTVPHDAGLDSDDRPAVWLTELDPLVEIPEPETTDFFYTKSQVDQKFTDHIGLSVPDWDPHPQYEMDAEVESYEAHTWVGTVSATRWPPLTTTMTAQRIAAVALVCAGNIAASDTDYWTVELVRWRAGIETTIATRTTQTASPNGGVTAYVPWTFDAITLSAAQYFAAGDALGMKISPTGTPAAWPDLAITWLIEPGVTP